MKIKEFKFLKPGKLTDKDLALVLKSTAPEDKEKGYVPSYSFKMVNSKTREEFGEISLRVGQTENTFYGGNIGYSVEEKFRGHHYAARACILIFRLAKKHKMKKIFITCNPDNIASRRTCELAGGKLIDIVKLPKYNDQYKRGERKKCIYGFDIK